MTKMMDYTISPLPIRIIDLKVDKSKLKIRNLIVTQLGHLPGRFSRRRNVIFNNWALAYIHEGIGTYQVNHKSVQKVSGGNIFFIWPGAVFDYGPNENEAWEEYYINFEGERAVEWDTQQLFRKEEIMQVGAERVWVQKIETIASLLMSGISSNGDRAALLLESLLFEFSLTNEEMLNHTKADEVQHIIDYLSYQIYDPIDVSTIAKRLNISISTLRRHVRLNTGYPFNEYLHRLKISEAKKILINSNKSVKEVALTLAYHDVYYFSRLFKKYTGSSPQIFRDNV